MQPAETESAHDTAAEAAPTEFPGFRQVTALAEAYPDTIEKVEIRDAEWALYMRERWYYWAGGRLLPEEERTNSEGYVSIRFYNYEMGSLREREISPELEERLRSRRTGRSSDTRLRFNGFLDALYGISSEAEAEKTMVRVELFGQEIRVHPYLVDPLSRVTDRVTALEGIDEEVAAFVDEIGSIHVYNWRNIAGTQQRSFHSYGIAVDLLPVSFGDRWAYWRWAVEGGTEEWWDIPLSERWQVPQGIVDAFEAEGFIWGGKWLLFDTMHFEYRPEAIVMARSEG